MFQHKRITLQEFNPFYMLLIQLTLDINVLQGFVIREQKQTPFVVGNVAISSRLA